MKFTRKRVPKLMFFLSFLVTLEGRAETLSWAECVRILNDKNPAIKAAAESLQATADQKLTDRGAFLPQITGAMSYDYTNSTPPSGTAFSTGASNGQKTYSASLTASQNLFNGLQDIAKQHQDLASIRVAEANLAQVKAQQSFNLMSAFGNLDYAKRSVKLALEIQKRREQNLALVDLRFKNGKENKGNVLLYQAYLSDAKYSVLQAQNNTLSGRTALAQALGWEQPETLDISGMIPLQEPREMPDLNKLLIRVPAHIKAQSTAEADEALIDQARSHFLPTLELTGEASKSGETFFPKNDRWSVGLNLQIPLFNGGHDYYSARAAAANYRSSALTVQDTDRQTLNTLVQGWTNYLESVEKTKVDQAYMNAADVRAAIARANYNNGLASFQDWDLTETDLITRQRSILLDELNRINAEATWMLNQGAGVIP